MKFLHQFPEITTKRLQFLINAYGSVPEFRKQIEQYKFYCFCFSDQKEEPVSDYYEFILNLEQKFSMLYHEIINCFHTDSCFQGQFAKRSNNLIILLQKLYNSQREAIRNNFSNYSQHVRLFVERFEKLFLSFKYNKAIEHKLFHFVFLRHVPMHHGPFCEKYFFEQFTLSQQVLIAKVDKTFVKSIRQFVDSSTFDQYIDLGLQSKSLCFIQSNAFKSLSLDNLKRLKKIESKYKDLECLSIAWQVSMCQDVASIAHVCSIDYSGGHKNLPKRIVEQVLIKLTEFDQLNLETIKLCLPGLCFKPDPHPSNPFYPSLFLSLNHIEEKYYVSDQIHKQFIQSFVSPSAISPYDNEDPHWFMYPPQQDPKSQKKTLSSSPQPQKKQKIAKSWINKFFFIYFHKNWIIHSPFNFIFNVNEISPKILFC